MVPGARLELARPKGRGILNPLCLPISPPGLKMLLVKTNYALNEGHFTQLIRSVNRNIK